VVDAHETHVIVGAGLAGAKAAETLRAEGFTGRVILVGDEREHPYERPGLSKGFLAGSSSRAELFVHDSPWYAAHEVELRLGSPVTRLDRAERAVELADGTVLHYDRLLLATGSSPRPLDIPRLASSPTPSGCGPPCRPSAGRTAGCCWSARAGSAWRWPPPPAPTAPR
jgi:3-phenylpropionate/trans-cinnamate dioxygenase ferredoxin reductase subunit